MCRSCVAKRSSLRRRSLSSERVVTCIVAKCGHVRVAVIARIGRDARVRRELRLDGRDHRDEPCLLRAVPCACASTVICWVRSTAATPVSPWITPFPVASFARSLSVRWLFRIAPVGPRRSSGVNARQWRNCVASRSSRVMRWTVLAARSGSTGRASDARRPFHQMSRESVQIPKRPFVAVSNHESYADIFLISHLPWEMKWFS